jgi:hypothetical protein
VLRPQALVVTNEAGATRAFFIPFEEGAEPGKGTVGFSLENVKGVVSVLAGITEISYEGNAIIGDAVLRVERFASTHRRQGLRLILLTKGEQQSERQFTASSHGDGAY